MSRLAPPALSWDLVLPFKFLGKGGSDDFCVSQGAPTDPLEEVMIFGDAQSLLGELMGIKVGFQGVKREPSFIRSEDKTLQRDRQK